MSPGTNLDLLKEGIANLKLSVKKFFSSIWQIAHYSYRCVRYGKSGDA